MKSLIHPLPPGLSIDTALGLENEQSSTLATHASPDVPLPLDPNVGGDPQPTPWMAMI